MSVSKNLKNAVTSKNIVDIRDCLWSRIVLDSNFSKGFPEIWQYCIDNGISEDELFEPHDNRPMSDELSNENFSALCGELSTNFSRERLEKIKEIGRKLYPVTEEKTESQTLENKNAVHHKSSSSSGQDDGNSGLCVVGLAVGAVAFGTLGWAIFGKAVAVGIGVVAGAALGGTVGTSVGRKSSKK